MSTIILFSSISIPASANWYTEHVFYGHISDLSDYCCYGTETVTWWVDSNGPINESINAANEWAEESYWIDFSRHTTLLSSTM